MVCLVSAILFRHGDFTADKKFLVGFDFALRERRVSNSLFERGDLLFELLGVCFCFLKSSAAIFDCFDD
jgi:hypothetical protein